AGPRAQAPAVRPELRDAVRRAGADPVDRGERPVPVLLLQLRASWQFPWHWTRVPARPVACQSLSLGSGGVGAACPIRPGISSADQPSGPAAAVLHLNLEDDRPAH